MCSPSSAVASPACLPMNLPTDHGGRYGSGNFAGTNTTDKGDRGTRTMWNGVPPPGSAPSGPGYRLAMCTRTMIRSCPGEIFTMAMREGTVTTPANTPITISREKSTRGSLSGPGSPVVCRRHRSANSGSVLATTCVGVEIPDLSPTAIVANGHDVGTWL